MQTIAVINPALYGGLVKILSFLGADKDSTDSLAINNGILIDTINTGFIRADLTELFQDHSIEFLDPARSTKLMGLLKGGDNFVFLDDPDQNKYHITNVISSISIPKSLQTKTITIPEFNKELSSVELDAKVVGNIADAQKTLDADKMILEVDPNTYNIVKININDVYEYNFNPGYEGEVKKYNLFNFRPIKGSGYVYKIFQKDTDFWLKIIIDLDLIEVEYFEKLTEAHEFSAYTLY